MGAVAQAIRSKGEICGRAYMIFVTVGNHFQSFDRLIKKVDDIASRLPHEIVIQRGYSGYRPQHTKHFDFVPISTAVEYIKTSDLVISHAGIGTIILCKEYGIPLIIFPRRKKYGEHGTDHQMEIAQALEERKDVNIYMIYEEDQLGEKIVEVLKDKKKPLPTENVGKKTLIRIIREFVDKTGNDHAFSSQDLGFKKLGIGE
jgi:beta-1,4-N-acetylglucosaminyltransferase